MQTKTSCKLGSRLFKIMILMPIMGLLAAAAVPNFVKDRAAAQKKSCIANLLKIDGAKNQWAVEAKQSAAVTPADKDIYGVGKYIRAKPRCPGGGTYSMNAISIAPSCSKGASPHFHTCAVPSN